jgi:SAM-dependent methyltransferase
VESDAAEISSARDYYRRILPFYEKESVAQAHLAFWRRVAKSHPHRRILEIGAGLGRITAELARVGRAVGLDVSLEMLSAARRRTESARFVAAKTRRAQFVAAKTRRAPFVAAKTRRTQFVAAKTRRAQFVAADARRPTFGPEFDLIVAPGDPISHMTTLADRRRALRAIARQLAPGGVFVLEGLYRRRDEVAMPRRRIPHARGVLWIEERWIPFGRGELWNARYRYDDRRSDGSVRTETAEFLARAWNPATIGDLFAEAGLAVSETRGGYEGQPFDEDSSHRLLVTGRLVSRAGRALPLRTSGTRVEALIEDARRP